MRRIGLVVAMPEETVHILDKLGEEISKENVLGYQIIIYRYDNKKVILINSGVGEITSAAATMLLISKYKAQCIINYGLCGALKSGIEVGDLLIAKDIVHYDFDISQFTNYRKGQYNDSASEYLPTDKKLIRLADKINGSKIRKVRIASADKFVASKVIKESLIKEFDADVCEMESAGIIRVCNKAGIPALFIKMISDCADESADKDIKATIDKGITAYSQLIEGIIKKV